MLRKIGFGWICDANKGSTQNDKLAPGQFGRVDNLVAEVEDLLRERHDPGFGRRERLQSIRQLGRDSVTVPQGHSDGNAGFHCGWWVVVVGNRHDWHWHWSVKVSK